MFLIYSLVLKQTINDAKRRINIILQNYIEICTIVQV